MKKQHYDIFISYRRDTGRQYARILQMALEKIGYRVFLDYDELTDGIFGDNIRQAVLAAPIFMPILSPQYLVRCANEGDWVREEIMLAIKEGKHFVPVNPDNTHDGIPDGIPTEIVKAISDNQHSEILFGQTLNATIKMMVDNRLMPHVKPHVRPGRMLWWIIPIMLCIIAAVSFFTYRNSQEKHRRIADLEQCRTKADFERFISLYPGTDEAAICQDRIEQMKALKNEGRVYVGNTNDDDVRIADKQAIDVKWSPDISMLQLEAIIDIFDRMMFIPAKDSTFVMGRADDISYDGPAHKVTLTEDFYMSQYEITRGWWHAVLNDSLVVDDADLPISDITIADIDKFISTLNNLTDIPFSLPTEAQWEWAATGNSPYAFAGGDDARLVAWYANNSDSELHKVGSVGRQSCNDNQLYDMSGNVAEWCIDYMSRYGNEAVTDPVVDMPRSRGKRVVRGGSILSNERDLNVKHRAAQSEDIPNPNIGFRIVFKTP